VVFISAQSFYEVDDERYDSDSESISEWQEITNRLSYYEEDQVFKKIKVKTEGGGFIEVENVKIKLEFDDGEKAKSMTVISQAGSRIKVNGNDFSNVREGGEFVVGENGELIAGSKFVVGISRKFILKGHDINLPKGAEVSYEKDKIVIKVLNGKDFTVPELVDEKGKGVLFEIEAGKGGIKLSDNEFVQGLDGVKTKLYFKDGRVYSLDDEFVITNSDGKKDFIVRNLVPPAHPNIDPPTHSNLDGKEVYLVLDESELSNDFYKDKNFVFLGNSKIILGSNSGEGVSGFLHEDNRVNAYITKDNTIAFQAKGGRVWVEKGGEDGIPNIKLSGESVASLDKGSYYVSENKLYYDVTGARVKGFEHGEYQSAVKITSVNNKGERTENHDVFTNNGKAFVSLSLEDQKKFESSLKFLKIKAKGLPEFYVSSSLTFNQLSPEAQKFYDEMSGSEQAEVVKDLGNVELQQRLGVLIREERERRNPLEASVHVELPGVAGGSGTIIGYDKEGHAIVLTAGHIGGTSRKGTKYEITFPNGKTYWATSLGGYGKWRGDEGWDVELLKIDKKIPNLAYVPVASKEFLQGLKKGTRVLRFAGRFKENGQVLKHETSLITIRETGDTITYDTKDKVYSGQSGSGLISISRRKLIGVLSSSDLEKRRGIKTRAYYSSLGNIHYLLEKEGLSHLIKVIMVIVPDYEQ